MIKYFTAIIIPVLLLGCQPALMYKTMPFSGKQYYSERSILCLEDNNTRIFLNYDFRAENFLSFFITIYNKSGSALTVYPEDFYMEIFIGDSAADGSSVPSYAIDPEYIIDDITEEIIILDSVKALRDSMDYVQKERVIKYKFLPVDEELAEIQNKIDEREKYYRETKYYLEEELAHWQYETLRRVTLMPYEKAAGIFYIPVNEKAKWFRIIIPIGNKEYVFNYKN